MILETHEEELLVPKKYLNKGLDGDLVSVSFIEKEEAYVAHVEEIIERKRKSTSVSSSGKKSMALFCVEKGMYTDLFYTTSEITEF